MDCSFARTEYFQKCRIYLDGISREGYLGFWVTFLPWACASLPWHFPQHQNQHWNRVRTDDRRCIQLA